MEEWFGLMRDCMKDYLKTRVFMGLWIEPGSHYAHINFDVMIDLYEAAPDPEVRQRARMFLDLALIEDEQIREQGGLPGTAAVVILGDAMTGNISPLLVLVSVCTAAVGVGGLIYETRRTTT